jgi:glycosyltransferase involved in cell wall biosynthesis
MSQTPEFTVIIPCYNDAMVLPRAVNSVVRQTCADWEIVIVDDGSTDATPQVAAEIVAANGSRLRYHRQPNSGVSAARNAGIDLARHAFVVFVDADDELMPEALAIYADIIRASSSAPRWIVGAHEVVRKVSVKLRKVRLPATRATRFERFVGKDFYVGNVSNMCFGKEVFQTVRFSPRLRVGEDTAIFALLFALVDPLVTERVTARINRRLTSLRTQSSLEQLAQSKITTEIFDHPALPTEFARYKPNFEARRARSLAGHAHRAGQKADVLYWSAQALRLQPGLWLSPKFVLRYLQARLA